VTTSASSRPHGDGTSTGGGRAASSSAGEAPGGHHGDGSLWELGWWAPVPPAVEPGELVDPGVHSVPATW